MPCIVRCVITATNTPRPPRRAKRRGAVLSVHCGDGALPQVKPFGQSLLREAAHLLGVRRLLLEARQQALP